MASELQNQPFKNREHIKAEITRCARSSTVFAYLSFLFAIIGIIGDALKTTLVLQPLIWLLLAVFTSLHAIVPAIHLVVAKHLLGIEAESKK
ncbi:MAG: hypothetical protein ABSB71_08260 [Candidatus Bathyarchaeia archaeon]|jgi:hypothetical protein